MKEKAIEPKYRGCLNCPAPQKTLDMRRRIAVGFGDAHLECNGKIIWSEGPQVGDYDDCMSVRQAENRARKKRGDWRIVLHGPLHGETYQRQEKNNWVCIESNAGFA